MRSVIVLAAGLLTVGPLRAQTAELDASYGEGGFSRLHARPGASVFKDARRLADGRLVAVGGATVGPARGLVARYLPDGRLDVAFGDGGVRLFDRSAESVGTFEFVEAVGDGLLAAGAGSPFALVRLLSGGAPDPTFGGDGVASWTESAGFLAGGRITRTLQDGSFLVLGQIEHYGQDHGADHGEVSVARVLADGTVDRGFGADPWSPFRWLNFDGVSNYDGRGHDRPDRAVVLPDGTVLVAGVVLPTSAAPPNAGMLRFRVENGRLTGLRAHHDRTLAGVQRVLDLRADSDTSVVVALGIGGAVVFRRFGRSTQPDAAFGAPSFSVADVIGEVTALAVTPAGYTVAGTARNGAGAAVVRVRLDFSRDDAYGGAGAARLDNVTAERVVTDGDGLLVAGSRRRGSEQDAYLARLDAGGRPDAAFGPDGAVTLSRGGSADAVEAFAVAPDSGSVVAGLSDNGRAVRFLLRVGPGGRPDPAFGAGGRVFVARTAVAFDGSARVLAAYRQGGAVVERRLPTGALDLSFGAGGSAVVATPPGWDSPASLHVQRDGRVVGMGRASTSEAFVFRLTADGQPDEAFGTRGVVRLPTSPFGASLSAADDGDGLLVAGTTYGSPDNRRLFLFRLRADGSPDPAFGTGGLVRGPVGSGAERILRTPERIVVAGNASGSCAALFTFRPDGAPDEAFGARGVAATDACGDLTYWWVSRLTAVLPLPGGGFMAAGPFVFRGTYAEPSYTRALVVRFTARGALDPTFRSPLTFDEARALSLPFTGFDGRGGLLLAGGETHRRTEILLARLVVATPTAAPPEVEAGRFDLRSYPSPASGPVTVDVTLPSPSRARIEVFDLLGRRVVRLHDGPLPAGPHRFTWRAETTGTYWIHATTASDSRVRAVVVTH